MASIQHVELLRPVSPGRHGQLLPNHRVLRVLQHALQKSIAIVVFLGVWEIAPRVGLVEPAFLPPFSTVVASGWELVKSGQLANHVRASLSRSLLGFVLAIVLAVPLGLAIG
ncbi:MAG TPA: hypothetical protein VG963_02705, partial [Polyangiaceae bacterium]|nr:hypothetical protein [Polyangiaceae bacterium]